MKPNLTQHAEIRSQQRGVPQHLIHAVITHADFEAYVGKGCVALSISRQRLSDPEMAATLGAARDRLKDLCLVVANDTGEVVTVLKAMPGGRGRVYRRGR